MRSQIDPATHSKKRSRLVILASVGLLLISTAILVRISLPVHPHFGAIYEVIAMDFHVVPSETAFGKFLHNHAPKRILQSRLLPARFKSYARYVEVGDAQLCWSASGTNSGWLYFWGRSPAGGFVPNKWEFAACAETDLMKISKLPTEFYGEGDSALREVFGDSATTNAIRVSSGQIVFARWLPETNFIYIFKFGERRENGVLINYCIKNQQ